VNLDKVWGMATAGAVISGILGDLAIHYPSSYFVLPSVFALFSSFLYTIPGSFLIPLCVVRILAPIEHGAGSAPRSGARALRAVPPVLCAWLVNLLFLLGWQWLVRQGPHYWIHSFIGGGPGDLITWLVAVVGGYALVGLVLYVPVLAVGPGARFSDALLPGIRQGARLLGYSLALIVLFLWPALPFLAVVQIRPAILITKFRPELVAVLLGVYAVLSSAGTYLMYAAAVRLHLASRSESQ
jgi:hypothetical protein